ncbi:uncharacterized protein MEPE_01865 [Melanopsichium pennsylvanicum]|uniref:N-acetyl-D-glucosamine kinase n=2 Tax=Melanopsichium pennsylvanicum TaxID=63383 RepID=A0AAJ5C459_9BASI|nr:conserved hypothetical protein [Melanopsichium pennsylvanicum 4]SNX83159.1 uncharacterized protein MEPE_01865 [Melanopsichium pennsylvanicum]
MDPGPSTSRTTSDVVLCVDAGGTKTLAVAATSHSKVTFTGQAGCGNCATLGLKAASQVILRAVRDALNAAGYGTFLDLIEAREMEGITTPPLSLSDNDSSSTDSDGDLLTTSTSNTASGDVVFRRPRVRAIWIGSAGLSSNAVISKYRAHLSQLLQEFHLANDATPIWITNDAVLLSAPMLRDATTQSCVCLIAGTGSAGFAFQRTIPSLASPDSTSAEESEASHASHSENEDLPGLTTISKTGGWGYLLGDRGSGWSIGLSTIQLMLTREEQRQFSPLPLTDFEQAVLQALDVSSPIELIPAAYRDRVCATGGNFFHAEDARKRWLAEANRVVFDYAFEANGRTGKHLAIELLHQAIGECIDSIAKLCQPSDRIKPEQSTLVLGGGLWSNANFLQLLIDMWKRDSKHGFKKVHVVESPAHEAATYLAQKFLGVDCANKK